VRAGDTPAQNLLPRRATHQLEVGATFLVAALAIMVVVFCVRGGSARAHTPKASLRERTLDTRTAAATRTPAAKVEVMAAIWKKTG